MKTIALRVLKSAMCLSYLAVKSRQVRRKVSMLSRQSNEPSADFLLLADIIKERCPDAEIVVLTKMIEGHLLSYPFHVLKMIGHIATSKLVIIDGYCIPVSCLDLKDETKVIQIWHAQTAVKKFGRQILGKPSGNSPKVAEVMKMHENYDYVIAPSKATAYFFSEGMGTDISKFVYAYAPHTTDMIRRAGIVRMEKRTELGLDDSKKTVLYAPTFRKGAKAPANELFRCIDRDKYDFVFRPHPIDNDLETLDEGMKIDTESSIYDLITAADIVITDYSSIMVETLMMDKELYIYAYDIDSYRDDPGLNIDPGSGIAGSCYFTEAEQIGGLLEKEYDKAGIEPLKKLLIDDEVPVSDDRLADLIQEILK